MSVFRLNSKVMNYAWGSRSEIPALLGWEASREPVAELWMGAHSKAPSVAHVDGNDVPLDSLLGEDPARFLGAPNADRFGPRLPFLFKILAASEPLSLQLHPTLEQARRGFEREEAAGTHPDARIYADRSHKPELVCALTRFEALSGFRELGAGQKALSTIGLGEAAHPLFESFVAYLNDPSPSGLERFVRTVLLTPPKAAKNAIDASVEVAVRQKNEPDAKLFLQIVERYPADPGAFLVPLLNYLVLAPGEALFMPAGAIHAYLHGTGLEVMASSDNVLRAGLTKKPIHVEEVLELTAFEPSLPAVVEPVVTSESNTEAKCYPTPAAEFELTRVELRGGRFSAKGPAIALVLEGTATVSSENSLSLGRGEHAFVSVGSFSLEGDARVALVGLNPHA